MIGSGARIFRPRKTVKRIDDVKTWMTVNKLEISDDKTQPIIVSSGRKSISLSSSHPDSDFR